MKLPLLLLASGILCAQAILPAPARLEPRPGSFTLDTSTRIVASGETLVLAETLARGLRTATGLPLPVGGRPGRDTIALRLERTRGLGDEGYELESGPGGVTITGSAPAGIFYGIQTLRQLLPAASFRDARVDGVPWTLPGASIQDAPRFPWRGSHLDVARHFMPKSAIKRHLDLMALHKLNVFHWHLVDDQGWRLEIRKYPRLTQVGAWRKETVLGETQKRGRPDLMRFDNTPHGGFYTQDDVREIVRYAADRFITVMPEIEMPGHSTAALAAYPQFGNAAAGAREVLTFWGITEGIYSVDDATIGFLKDVLDEVLALFPSPFIHVGGDECPKTEWARSPRALARMKELGFLPAGATLADLATEPDAQGRPTVHPALHRLQSWFIGQFDAFLASRGRRLVGWDEILEGGLAKGATVMSWRGEEGGVTAAKAGHDVVMAPEGWVYLDHYSSAGREPLAIGVGVTTLERVYGYEPVPESLDAVEARHVLGSQGQLWTEYVATPRHMEYMLWPRLAALAERLWSPRSRRDFPEFRTRLKTHLDRLGVLDVNFRPLDE
ncbi:MAG: beta-N-acetylhexosaminidase [Holophaga sp.]|nr:beta-N-acetylhexosaminidase [Holophaga sp.]